MFISNDVSGMYICIEMNNTIDTHMDDTALSSLLAFSMFIGSLNSHDNRSRQ